MPWRGASSPEMVLSVVVLPAPLLPSRATISPLRTSSETPLRAWICAVVDVEAVKAQHWQLREAPRRPRYASMTRASLWT